MCDTTTIKYLSDICSICQKDPTLNQYAEEGIQKIIDAIQSEQQQLNDDSESYKNLKIYEKIQKYINDNNKTFPKIKDFKLFFECILKTHKNQTDCINKPSTSFRKKEMYACLQRLYDQDNSIFDQIINFINDPERNKV